MKVLIVSSYEHSGGAARAANRLHRSLLEQGVNSQMLVQDKNSNDYTVLCDTNIIKKSFNKIRPILDSIPVRLYKNKDKTLFSPSWLPLSNIVKKINQINPDVVHLHWICGGMIKIEDMAKINAPIVWSLHDNWAFTGGCHIKWECEKYLDKCGSCPRLKSLKVNDLSHRIWKRKRKTFAKLDNLVIVGLSNWINSCSKSSALLKDKKHVQLPNSINTDVFKPIDQNMAREIWNLPKDKKLILFGAMNATSDINKGFKELQDSISKLTINANEVELVVFGSSKPVTSQGFGFKTHYLGYVYDDVSLTALFSAVDVMVVPSIQENLSNSIMESLSCSTPVVGFNIGGNSDMVVHKETGYLANPYDINDLASGIDWILGSKSYLRIAQASREKILKEFDSVIVAQKYIDLYQEVIKNKQRDSSLV